MYSFLIKMDVKNFDKKPTEKSDFKFIKAHLNV
jgi:hypothetical protein